jgi:hypothetical protein
MRFLILMIPNPGQPFTRQEIELETKNKTSTQIVIKKPHLSIFVEVSCACGKLWRKLRYINGCFSLKLDCEDVLE